MALLQEIQVPLLSVNDTSLTVVEINFSTGDPVNKGDIIMVFETSKTTYDVEAETAGIIHYLCEPDRDYDVNQVVARIYSEAAEAAADASARPMPSSGALPPSQPDAGPQPGVGQHSSDQPMAMGRSLTVGQTADAGPQPEGGERSSRPLPLWEGETLFSGEALRLIASSGIGRAAFAGRDFVSKWDVLEVLQPGAGAPDAAALSAAAPSSALAAKAPKPAPAKTLLPADPAKVILEKLSSGKRREIEYLSDIQSTGLTSTLHIFIETENIFTHINRSLRYLKDSLLPVIIYEASRLLTDYPLLNAYFTGETIARYREINTGFAIDIDKGLKVLKIARAEQKSISEIEQAILQLSGSYLDETLQIEDLTDITFTITDLSSEGVAFFRPLINKMNSSILGVSSIDEKLRRCTLSLTFDHRVTEGRLAARYLKELKDRLESYRAADPASREAIACFKCYKTLKEDLSGTGFTHCITPEGKEGYICQSCLKGF